MTLYDIRCVQMIGIVQAKATPLVFQLLGSESFERGLGGHGHKDGERNGAVG